mgnify:CR=1 FL=1
MAGFGALRDDGTTACGNWIYAGCWQQSGNMTARRDLAEIGEEALVGPFCYLRPGTVLGPRAKAGGFVEMKAAVVGFCAGMAAAIAATGSCGSPTT